MSKIHEEEAKRFYNLFYNTNDHLNSIEVRHKLAKSNAVKCVGEIIEENKKQAIDHKDDFRLLYLIDIKNEIQKL